MRHRIARPVLLTMVAALAASTLGLPAPGLAAEPTVVVAGYGGSFQKGIETSVIPDFEKAYHCHVNYVTGASTDTLAKLQAERSAPQIDVAIIDDGPQAQARQLGLIAPLDPKLVTNLADVYPIARLQGDLGVGLGIVATGLVYNTKYFAEHHWKPLESWKDLANPELNGKLVLPSITNTYGVHLLVMEARANGGSVTDIEPGFAFMKKIAPMAVNFDKTADVSNYFLQGSAVASAWSNARANILKSQGFPIEFVYPKEGAVALMSTVNVVKNAPNPQLAQEFVNYLLAAKTQEMIAQTVFFGPTNRTATLPPKAQAMVVYGPAQIAKLVKMNWTLINQQRAAWTNRWEREIESR
ncbi:MAG TPA: ABC transporter substrate-binding protein [Candidatus Dormibacteraeota bacterium]|nr:ABC transporter substrate-binding protein [Candidatus Dormibacteraeota bacterium]